MVGTTGNTEEPILWLIDGTTVIAATFLPTANTEWFPTTDDYNGDGRADILWRNVLATGENAMWLMDGTTVIAAAFLPTVGTDWDTIGLYERADM